VVVHTVGHAPVAHFLLRQDQAPRQFFAVGCAEDVAPGDRAIDSVARGLRATSVTAVTALGSDNNSLAQHANHALERIFRRHRIVLFNRIRQITQQAHRELVQLTDVKLHNAQLLGDLGNHDGACAVSPVETELGVGQHLSELAQHGLHVAVDLSFVGQNVLNHGSASMARVGSHLLDVLGSYHGRC